MFACNAEGKELAEEDFMLLMQSFAEGRPPSKWDTSSDVETSPTHDDDFSFIEVGVAHDCVCQMLVPDTFYINNK